MLFLSFCPQSRPWIYRFRLEGSLDEDRVPHCGDPVKIWNKRKAGIIMAGRPGNYGQSNFVHSIGQVNCSHWSNTLSALAALQSYQCQPCLSSYWSQTMCGMKDLSPRTCSTQAWTAVLHWPYQPCPLKGSGCVSFSPSKLHPERSHHERARSQVPWIAVQSPVKR